MSGSYGSDMGKVSAVDEVRSSSDPQDVNFNHHSNISDTQIFQFMQGMFPESCDVFAMVLSPDTHQVISVPTSYLKVCL
jgi:hypothetical protein